MRGFEDYCWRDLLTEEMATIYAAYHRERRVAARSVVLVVHPGEDFHPTTGDWHGAAAQIVAAARGTGLPILHSIPPGNLATARLAPQPRDAVMTRTCDSAFFFCNLEAVLTRLDANGIILCGAPSSGALRASTIEAKSYGYHAAIAEEATADEAALLHKMALFDLAHKYADVMAVDELIEALRAADPRAVAS
jgi:nicotinamidase-related amidase